MQILVGKTQNCVVVYLILHMLSKALHHYTWFVLKIAYHLLSLDKFLMLECHLRIVYPCLAEQQ